LVKIEYRNLIDFIFIYLNDFTFKFYQIIEFNKKRA
jgi:hypothetical protein